MPEILGTALEFELQHTQTLDMELESPPALDLHTEPGGIVTVPTEESPVSSVNGKTGNVELDAEDVGALPDSTVIPSAVSHLQNDLGFVRRAEMQPDDGANLVDTVQPTYYYGASSSTGEPNCRAVGDRFGLDVSSSNSTSFRISTTETLKGGEHYILSFRASGCGSSQHTFYLMYATANSGGSIQLGNSFTIKNGTVTVPFTPAADSLDKRIFVTNYGIGGRTAKKGIVLDGFKIERGTAATNWVPNPVAVNKAAQLDKWQRVQDRIYQEAVNQWPLYFVSDKTVIDSTAAVSEYSALQPLAVYSWARKELSLVGNFKVKTGATISDGDVIFTGLPMIRSDVTIYNALSWVANGKLCSGHVKYTKASNLTLVEKEWDNSSSSSSRPTKGTSGDKILLATGGICTCTASYVPASDTTPATPAVWGTPTTPSNGDVVYNKETTVYKTRVSGSWVLRYTPCGVLEFEQGDGDTVTIAAGTSVRFDPRPIPMATPYGSHRFPKLSATDVHNAAQWLISARGKYDYSNNGRWRRMIYNDSNQPYYINEVVGSETYLEPTKLRGSGIVPGYGATDCAGIIHQAFRYGAGKFVPDGSKSQAGFGRIVTFARKGEYLDTSLLQEGDVVGYIETGGDGETWAVNHVAMAVSVNGEIQLWHVSSSYGSEYYTDYKHGEIANGKDKPRGSAGDDKTFGPQPVRGTYNLVGGSGTAYRGDADKSYFDARIVVRWADDAAVLDSSFA